MSTEKDRETALQLQVEYITRWGTTVGALACPTTELSHAIADAIAAARQQGAEEMRERAARFVRALSFAGKDAVAAEIRAFPLLPPAPKEPAP